MWERFTENSRHVLFFAQTEAAIAKTTAIAPEHILLALLRDESLFACRVLKHLVADLEIIRGELREIAAVSVVGMSRGVHLSDSAQRAIDKGFEEARIQNFINLGPEHIFLGVLGDVSGSAAVCLARYGVDVDRARAAITKMRPTQFAPRISELPASEAVSATKPARQAARFTDRGRQILLFAREEARRFQTGSVATEHLLLGLLRNTDAVAVRLLERIGVPLGDVQAEIQRQILEAALLPGAEQSASGRTRLDWLGANLEAIQTGIQRQIAQVKGGIGGELELSQSSKDAIDFACEEAERLGHNFVGTEHLLLGLVREGRGLAARALSANDVSLDRTREAVLGMHNEARTRLLSAEPFPAAANREGGTTLPRALGAPGDLGTATSTTGRAVIDVAQDLPAYLRLQDTFATKDGHGYRALVTSEKTIVLVADGTPLKLLLSPSGTDLDGLVIFYVRILSGDFEGRSGWVDQSSFSRTGSDKSDFPPEIQRRTEMRYENEMDLYIENLCGHVGEMVYRLRQIPPEMFDFQAVTAAPSPRILARHTYHWLVCDRAHITEPDARLHARVPEPPYEQGALCDALAEENLKWRDLLQSLTPETLLAERSQFNQAPMNVRAFVGHMLQNCIYKNGQLATIYFALGLDGSEPYDAPWPNTYYELLSAEPDADPKTAESPPE